MRSVGWLRGGVETPRPRRTLVSIASATMFAALASRGLGAQSAIGNQGFGYPPGQLSARAAATGGSIAEMDPWSPVNPSSISMLGSRMMFFQIEPEFRTVESASGTDHTVTARYPVVLGALRVSDSWVLGIGASTLLDRSSETITVTPENIGGTQVNVTTQFQIEGGVNDVRLAGGYQPLSWLRLGLGVHAITGRNLVTVTESFSDTLSFSGFTEQRLLSFSGGALSLGAQVFSKNFLAAASYRQGGRLDIEAGDTLLGRANVPSRFGASIAFIGSTNTAIAIRTSHERWSSLIGLGTPAFGARDAWDSGIGADIAGPQLGSHPLMVRLGGRVRTLPFAAGGRDVTEKSLSTGLGTLWGQGRVVTDLALIRADRDAGLPTTEKAWILAVGVTIRP